MKSLRVHCPLCDSAIDSPWPGSDKDQAAMDTWLKNHLGQHTVLEWLQKVTSLQNELEKLKAKFP